MFDIDKVIIALRDSLPKNRDFLPLHEPRFAGNEWSYLKECLDTGWVSSVGKFVDRFEKDLAAFTGVRRAVAVVNGTAALHICLVLIGIKAGDEVIIPTLTFVATANAVSYCGAIPHFIDSSYATLGTDPEKLDGYLREIGERRSNGCYNRRTGRRIGAVVPMHTFGHPVELDHLQDVCRSHGIVMVEDAAESLGSYYKEKHTGNWGVVSALSFNGNKIITTGGGGAILTNDEKLAALAKHLTTTARITHPWQLAHDMTGYNYRLPNINAALGCAQLEKLSSYIAAKRSLARRYQKAFSGVPGVTFFTEPADATSNYWLNVLLLDRHCVDSRERLLELTNKSGIQTRPAWTLMHQLSMYRECPRMDLSVAEDIEKRLINLPSGPGLCSAAE